MIARLINVQGWAGIAAGLALLALLLVEKSETRHWRKLSRQYEQLYRAEVTAHAGTIANYRVAAEAARAADEAAAQRVAAEQRVINERTAHDYEARLAAARAAANRLRQQRTAAANPGTGRNPPMPGLPVAPGQPPQAPGQDRLPDALLATEQAIQLDELIRWVRAQAQVDPNAGN